MVAAGVDLPAAPVYQVEIISAELSVGRIQPKQPNIPLAIYPYTKVRTQRHILPRGLTEFGPVTIASGILPERAWVAMITEQAFTGSVRDHRLYFRVSILFNVYSNNLNNVAEFHIEPYLDQRELRDEAVQTRLQHGFRW